MFVSPCTEGFACRQATSSVHYTTSCKQSSAPEDGRNYRPKYVELIEIINKIIIVTSSGLFILLYTFIYSYSYKMEGQLKPVLNKCGSR